MLLIVIVPAVRVRIVKEKCIRHMAVVVVAAADAAERAKRIAGISLMLLVAEEKIF